MHCSCYNSQSMVSALVRAAVVAGMVLAAGCSLAVDPDQVQCKTYDDCVAIGFPQFACTNSACNGSAVDGCASTEWPASAAATTQVTISAFDLGMGTLSGVPVYACPARQDGDCTSSPLVGPVPTANGVATFGVAEGFRGHFYVPTSDPAVQAPYIVNMLPPPDPTRPHTLAANITVTGVPALEALAASLDDVTIDVTQGILFFAARDCQGRLLSDVTVEIAGLADTSIVYLDAIGNPDQSLLATGPSGGGVMINIPPQRQTVVGSLNGTQIFQQSLLFETGTITSTQIVPSTF